MEKVEHVEFEPETYENELAYWLQQFREEHKIEDLRAASQSVWNGALRYIYKHVFRGTDKLKSHVLDIDSTSCMKTTYGSYDYDKVDYILNIYIDLCMLYDKEISCIGFSFLTGIDDSTVQVWSNDKPSTKRFEISQKILRYREESLSNKLATGKQNPVGVLAILNRHYQWNLPGVSKEPAKQTALPAAELPKLSDYSNGNVRNNVINPPPELSDNL